MHSRCQPWFSAVPRVATPYGFGVNGNSCAPTRPAPQNLRMAPDLAGPLELESWVHVGLARALLKPRLAILRERLENQMPISASKVFAAIDFGDPSLEGLRQARTLAHGLEGTLAACHVLPSNEIASFLPEQDLNALAEDESARVALREHVRSKLGLELTELFIERGPAYAEIVRKAEVWGASFIVLGSHGRTGLARAVLGSVAERVARYAHCSVLVARASPSAGPVLVATDLSTLSLPAIAAGAAAAKRQGARLVVASVLEWSDTIYASAGGPLGMMPAMPPAGLRQQTRDAILSTLEGAMAQVGAEGEARVLDGSPASAIVECAEELGASLVVVGTNGRTGLTRLALGNVAERVIRSAGSSVLAVRPATA